MPRYFEGQADRDIAQRQKSLNADSSGWSASLYNKDAPFVYSAAFTSSVLELLAAKPGEQIIDFGCGSGEITLELKKLVEHGEGGLVVGVDFSESMIAKAKANGLEHAFVSDIQDLKLLDDVPGLESKFDAVFSNAALHWCKTNPKGVLTSARKVLKPGGRFVAEMGGFMNCIGLRAALHRAIRARGQDPTVLDPWYFPSVEQYEKLLLAASFRAIHMSMTPRITPLPTGLRKWLELFARHSFLAGFSDEEAEGIMQDVEEDCRVDCQDESGHWAITMMRLRFYAVLEE